jgi:hypothetical protein
VPASNILGQFGMGYKYAISMLNEVRGVEIVVFNARLFLYIDRYTYPGDVSKELARFTVQSFGLKLAHPRFLSLLCFALY